jgi:hypothetical protein
VGIDEDLLQNVLGVLSRAEHLTAEAEQPGLVAVDDRLEGVIVAPSQQRHEALVSLQPEQG